MGRSPLYSARKPSFLTVFTRQSTEPLYSKPLSKRTMEFQVPGQWHQKHWYHNKTTESRLYLYPLLVWWSPWGETTLTKDYTFTPPSTVESLRRDHPHKRLYLYPLPIQWSSWWETTLTKNYTFTPFQYSGAADERPPSQMTIPLPPPNTVEPMIRDHHHKRSPLL